jgi:E3 Ubiquitin ligase
MSQNKDFELPIALIFIGGGLLIKGLLNFRKSRKIQDTARIDISSAPQGLVELEGYAWPLEPPLSAVCGRQVVYYHYKVQQLVKRGKSSSWETRYQFNHNASFYVIDQSGVCIVNPNQDGMDLTEKITKLFAYGETIEQLKNFYSTKPGFLAQMFSGNYRLVEQKLFVGSPVYVCGNMQAMNLNQVKIRGDYKKFLTHTRTMSSNPIFKMSKLDINRDGKLSDEEIIAGFADVSKESSLPGIELEAKLAGTVSASETHDLIVADGHQEQYLKRLTSFNILKIWGGVAMIGAGLFFLVNL